MQDDTGRPLPAGSLKFQMTWPVLAGGPSRSLDDRNPEFLDEAPGVSSIFWLDRRTSSSCQDFDGQCREGTTGTCWRAGCRSLPGHRIPFLPGPPTVRRFAGQTASASPATTCGKAQTRRSLRQPSIDLKAGDMQMPLTDGNMLSFVGVHGK